MDLADYKLYVDWANNGNFLHACSDLSAYLLDAYWEFGFSSAPPEAAGAGTLHVTLDNSTSIFSPENTTSPLHNLIIKDLRVLIKMKIGGGSEVSQYGCRLRTITPVTGQTVGLSKAILVAEGVLSLLNKGIVEAVALQEDIDTGAALVKVLDADGVVGSTDRSIQTGQSTLSKWWVPKDTPKLQASRDLEYAELGRLREGKDGKLVFESRAHIFNAPHATPQATYGTGTLRMWNLRQEDPLVSIYDLIRGSVHTFNHSEDVTLAILSDVANGIGGKPFVVPAAVGSPPIPGTLEVWIELSSQNSPGNYVGVYDWTLVDYEANTAADGSGTDVTTNVSAVKTPYGPRLKIVFSNLNLSPAHLVVLRAHGIAIVEGDPIPVKSGTGKNECPYVNPWADDFADEQARCDHQLAVYGIRRPRLVFDVKANYDAAHLAEIQARDVGDRIRVVASVADFGLGIDGEFIVDRIERTVDKHKTDVMTVTCTKAPASQLGASGSAYVPKIVPPSGKSVPDDLWALGSANGYDMVAGGGAWKYNLGIYEAEFRAKWFATKQTSVDLRTAAEGGTFVGGTATEILVTGAKASEVGFNWTWDGSTQSPPVPGIWYYVFRLKNQVGWSVWSDGNNFPQVVTSYVETGDPAQVDSGPPGDWTVSVEAGPTPGTVVVKATRPQTNGNVIFFVAFQLKNIATGSWLPIDSNTSPASILYDGSAVGHTFNKTAGTLTRNSGTFPSLGIVPALMLFDVRGGAFAHPYCQWAGGDTANVGSTVITGLQNFRPDPAANLSDIRIMIVTPPWEWASGGYLGYAAYKQLDYWTNGGDHTTQTFVSPPLAIPAGVSIANVGARVWFENPYSRADGTESEIITGGYVHEAPFSAIKIFDELLIQDDDYPGGTAVKKFNGAYRYAANNGVLWYFTNLGLQFLVDEMPTQIRTYLDVYIANLLDDYSAEDVSVDANFKLLVNTTTGAPDPPKPPDSHDSYAATFLMLASKYIRGANDWEWLEETNSRFGETNLQTLLHIASHNITSQVKTTAWCITNGFPTGYPNGHDTMLVSVFQNGYRAQDSYTYDVGFTSDSCECYRGLKDFGDLLTDYGDSNAASILNYAQNIGVAAHGLYDVVNRIWVWNDTMIVWSPGDTWLADSSASGTGMYPDLFAGVMADLWEVPSTSGSIYDETRYNDGWERLNLLAPNWWELPIYDAFPNNHLGYLAAYRRKDVLKAAGQLEKFAKYYLAMPPVPGSPPSGTGLSGPTSGLAVASEVGFAVGTRNTLIVSQSRTQTSTATVLGKSTLPNVVLRGDDGTELQAQDGKLSFIVWPTLTIVNVSGTTVTRVSGNEFETDGWLENGDLCAVSTDSKMMVYAYHRIASVTDKDHLEVTESLGTLSNAAFKIRKGAESFQMRCLLIAPSEVTPEVASHFPAYTSLLMHDPNYGFWRQETTGDVYGPAWWMATKDYRWSGFVGVDDWWGVWDVEGQYHIEKDDELGGMPFFVLDQTYQASFGRGWNTPSATLDVAGDQRVRGYSHCPKVNVESSEWTDLVIDGADNTKMMSSAKPLGYWLVGHEIKISAGTGFTVQTVTVTAVENPAQMAAIRGGTITGVSISVAGSGYTVNDVVMVADGNGDGTVRVTAIGAGGAVTAIVVVTGGTGYQMVAGSHATSYGGGGTGLYVATNIHYFNQWRATCSAALGTLGSTGGSGKLLGVGIYFDLYPYIDVKPGTASLRSRHDLLLEDENGVSRYLNDCLQIPIIPSLSVVDTSGTAVTWVSGEKFLADGSWVDGVSSTATSVMGPWTQYEIASVPDDQHLVLKTSAGTHSGIFFACRLGGAIKWRTMLASPSAQIPEMLAGRPYVTMVLRDANYCGLRLETDGDVYAPYIAIDVQKTGGNRWVLYTGNDDWYGLFDILGKFFISEDSGGGNCCFTIDTGPHGNYASFGPHWTTPSHQLDIAGDGELHVRDQVITPRLNIEYPHWTDLAIDASDNTKMTSTATPLGSWLIGRSISIASGTGFTVQTVSVVSVENPVQTQIWIMTSASIHTPGSGYTALDVVTVSGGTGGTVRIDTVSGGGVPTAITLLTGGTGYGNLTDVATTGGTGAGLTLDTGARSSGKYRAKCSAALGALSSTGGVGDLLGQGLYFGGYPKIDLIPGTSYFRIQTDVFLEDVSANKKYMRALYVDLDPSQGIYFGGYKMILMSGASIQIQADVLFKSGSTYKAIDIDLLNIHGSTRIDASGNGIFINIYTKSEVYTKAEIDAILAGLTHSHTLPANTGPYGSPAHEHPIGGNTGDAL